MSIISYFAEKVLKKPTTGEKAQTEAWAFGSDMTGDANPNDFYEEFKNAGGVAEAVDTMEKYDPRLAGYMQTRKLGILSLEREIVGEGDKADFVREVFAGIPNMHNYLYDILSCIPAGHAITEKVWGERSGRFVYEDLKSWSQDRFTFKNKELFLSNGFAAKELADPTKFSVLTFQPKNGNPWGSALYQRLYWYWFLKRYSVKFWAVLTERFGSPVTIAHLPKSEYEAPNSMVKGVVKKFIKELSQTNAPSIAVPEGVTLTYLEAQRSGATESHEKFIQYLDDAMAIAILGQTLTSDVGSSGSYSLGKVHNQIRMDIVKADVLMLENFINDQLIKPLIAYNFPDAGNATDTADIPKWRIVTDDAIDKESTATAYKTLVEAGFYDIPLSHIHETFGIPIPAEGEATMRPATASLAAAPTVQPLDTMTAAEVIKRDQAIRFYMEDLKRVR